MLIRKLLPAALVAFALWAGSDRVEADGFVGDLSSAGVALALWEGGSVSDLPTLHPNVGSVWVTAAGSMVGYVTFAPAFVNTEFLSLYPGGVVPSGTPMLASVSTSTTPGTPPPSVPSPTPTLLFSPVSPHVQYIVNAELAGFESTTTAAPLAPARSQCSVAPEVLLNWGWPNGAQVTVVGTGIGPCADWTYLYEASGDSNYWLESRFVSLVAGVQPTPSPSPTEVPSPALGDVIHTCIQNDFDGWSGDTVFELCNGQVWVQTSFAYKYHYAYRPDVTLTRTSSGWQMSVEGITDPVSVMQVSFIRSCISGEFEGWSGDTTFELCNGQVWQQMSFDYTYRYAYRPDVLIYQSPGGGYRMSVEGVTSTIRVARLY